MTLKKEDNV